MKRNEIKVGAWVKAVRKKGHVTTYEEFLNLFPGGVFQVDKIDFDGTVWSGPTSLKACAFSPSDLEPVEWICKHTGKCDERDKRDMRCCVPHKRNFVCPLGCDRCDSHSVCIPYIKKEETMPKYKLLQPITLNAMMKAGARRDCADFRNFAAEAIQAGYWFNDRIPMEKALKWRRTEFLFDKWFVKVVEDKPEFDRDKISLAMGYSRSLKYEHYYVATIDKNGLQLIDGIDSDKVPFPVDEYGKILII